MQRVSTDRRDFMKAAGALAMTSAASTLGIRSAGAQQVPYSSGTEAPKLQAPANACDCHMHIYDAKIRPLRRPRSSRRTPWSPITSCCRSASARRATSS